jgi:hypothetical protein
MRRLRSLAFITLAAAAVVPAIIVACGGGSNNGLTGGTPNHGGGPTDDGSIPLGNDDAPSGYIPDADFDSYIPLNTVDGSAANRPEGGTPVTGGVILCGGNGGTCNAFAGNQCCTDDEGGACVSASIGCPSGGGAVFCNESADCIQGDICCGSVNLRDAGFDDAGHGVPPGTPYVDSQCAMTCNTSLLQLCRTNSECGDAGPCIVQSCPDGRTYELCGVFSTPPLYDGGPSFACTPQ